MTAINENGQVYWTFEELDLYEEYRTLFNESQHLIKRSTAVMENAIELAKTNDRFTFTDEYKEMVAKSHELYFRSRKLDEVAQLIYTLWIKEGENHV